MWVVFVFNRSASSIVFAAAALLLTLVNGTTHIKVVHRFVKFFKLIFATDNGITVWHVLGMLT